MSQGPSGRIVVELEPEKKRQLYSLLARDGSTFKDWLTTRIDEYVQTANQPPLFPQTSLPHSSKAPQS